MAFRRSLQTSLMALALGAGLAVSASAQVGYQAQPYHHSVQPMVQQGGPGGATPAAGLRTWNYNELYRTGWSAERLMDNAKVIGANGEDIGEIENIIVSQRGRILGIIAEVGGFWDIGDTHVFIPWTQVRVSPTLNRVVVPVTEDNVDDYASSASDVLTYFRAGQTQVVDDDLDTGPSIWKATDLIDDYAYLNDRRAYGYINDLIFSSNGHLQAVVVNAGSAWGGGYRALPFASNGGGWNPGSSDYYLGYGENDIANLERFDHNRLPARVMVNNQSGAGSDAQARNSQANVTGAVATQWTFRNIDRDGNLELTDREFSRVSRDVRGRWDANRDGRLDRNEFYGGLSTVFDANRDRRITQDEFNRGWRNWGTSDQQVSYSAFDANGDGVLDQNEFRTGLERMGYYDRWDADRNGTVARSEFNTGMYDVWDVNSDNVLAENEFNDLAGRSWF